MGKGTKQKFFKRRSTNGQITQEETFNIPGHKGSENQNHSEIPCYPGQMTTINNKNNNKCS
jgi:hypothetical protein